MHPIDDKELMVHIENFRDGCELLLEFLDNNEQYTTPKQYNRKKPIVK